MPQFSSRTCTEGIGDAIADAIAIRLNAIKNNRPLNNRALATRTKRFERLCGKRVCSETTDDDVYVTKKHGSV